MSATVSFFPKLAYLQYHLSSGDNTALFWSFGWHAWQLVGFLFALAWAHLDPFAVLKCVKWAPVFFNNAFLSQVPSGALTKLSAPQCKSDFKCRDGKTDQLPLIDPADSAQFHSRFIGGLHSVGFDVLKRHWESPCFSFSALQWLLCFLFCESLAIYSHFTLQHPSLLFHAWFVPTSASLADAHF